VDSIGGLLTHLAVAVLLQGLADLEAGPPLAPHPPVNGTRRALVAYKRRDLAHRKALQQYLSVKEWALSERSNCRMWCDVAGVSVEKYRERVRLILRGVGRAAAA